MLKDEYFRSKVFVDLEIAKATQRAYRRYCKATGYKLETANCPQFLFDLIRSERAKTLDRILKDTPNMKKYAQSKYPDEYRLFQKSA